MECAGAVQHRIELLDVECRRPEPVHHEDLKGSLTELSAGISSSARCANVLLAVVVKLDYQGLLRVDQLVDDLH
jgi:hypothetical protein